MTKLWLKTYIFDINNARILCTYDEALRTYINVSSMTYNSSNSRYSFFINYLEALFDW